MGKRTNTAVWLETQHRWQIKVQKDGKRRSFTSATPGRNGQRACNAKADAWLDEGVADTARRVDALTEEWLAGVKLTTSRGNWRPVESRWRSRVLPVIGSKRIDRVTEGQLQAIVDAAFADGLAKKTLQNLCMDMRSFYKWLRLHKYTTLQLEQLHVPGGARACDHSVLQPEDLRTLFSSGLSTYRGAVIDDPLAAAYRFQVASGLRPGELLGLRWTDIEGFRAAYTDWSALVGCRVRIARSVNIYDEETRGKNENAVRAFVLYPLLTGILAGQYRYTGTGEHIFPIASQTAYYSSWKRYCAYNQISFVSPYELRHTFISIAKTLPVGEVKELVGHSRNMDTFGVYGHALLGDSARVAADLSRLYGSLLE